MFDGSTSANDSVPPSPTLSTTAYIHATTTKATSLSPACSPVSSAKIGLRGGEVAAFSMLARGRTFSALQEYFESDEFGADAGSAEIAPTLVKPLTVALRAVENESGKQASQVD
jgi:hypothetical protein